MGIVSERGGRGKGLAARNRGDSGRDQGCSEEERGRQDQSERQGRTAGGTCPHPSARGGAAPRPGEAREGGPHEVSRAGAGKRPGRKTATRRRRRAGHPGHCPRSTPVRRHRRTATASGTSATGGSLASSARHRSQLGGAGPVRQEPEVTDPDEDGWERHGLEAVPASVGLPAKARRAVARSAEIHDPGGGGGSRGASPDDGRSVHPIAPRAMPYA